MKKDSCEPINTGYKGNQKFCLKAIVPTCNMQFAWLGQESDAGQAE